MNETQDAADTLDAAADHIRTRGLHNSGGWGATNLPDGPVCMLGAINMVRPEDGSLTWIWDKAVSAVWEVLGSNDSPTTWNDTPGRTAEEVMYVLMEAAARLRTAT